MFSVSSIFTNQYSSKMNKEIISIIVPVYNVERFLVQCLRSCVEQTYTNIEIICINDCSIDNSRLIIDDFLSDNRVTCIDNDQNRGVFFSKDLGAKNAKGTYIFFLDGDDYLEKDAIEKLFSVSDNSDIVAANMQLVDEQYQLLDRFLTWDKYGELNAEVFLNQVIRLNRWSQCCMLIKKEVYDKILHFPLEVKIREDALVLLQLCNYASKVMLVNQFIYNYVQRKSSALNHVKTADQRAKEDYDFAINAYSILNCLNKISVDNKSLIKLNLVKELSWILVSKEIKAKYGFEISKIIRQILIDKSLLRFTFQNNGVKIFLFYLFTILVPKFWVIASNFNNKKK